MKRYASQSPRAAFGVAAVAMTTLTIALLVALPAQVGTGSQDLSAVIAATSAPSATEVAISPARIDVIGVRNEVAASNTVASSKRKQRV